MQGTAAEKREEEQEGKKTRRRGHRTDEIGKGGTRAREPPSPPGGRRGRGRCPTDMCLLTYCEFCIILNIKYTRS